MIFRISKDLSFDLPEQLHELLGDDCWNLKQSVAKRLKQLGVSPTKVSSKIRELQTLEEFNQWYDLEAQQKLRVSNKETTLRFPNGEQYRMPDQWKQSLGDDVLSGKVSISMFLKSKGFNPAHISRLLRDNFFKIPEFVEWYDEDTQKRLKNEAARKTSLLKYGKQSSSMLSEEEMRQRLLRYSIVANPLPPDCSPNKEWDAICTTCGRPFKFSFYSAIPSICPFCNKNSTILERAIQQALISNGINIIPHYRKLEGSKEIDIYLPDLNIGFEINGALTHNSGYSPFGTPKQRNYHEQKTKQAEDLGISLYHLWEHWGIDKCLDVALAKCRIFKHRYYARKLTLSDSIQKDDVFRFLNKYHVEGAHQFSKAFCLLQGTEIIQVLTAEFQSEQTKISRLCTKGSSIVVGGTERLFKALLTQTNSPIISEAYRDLTPNPDNSIYARLGFKCSYVSEPMLFFYADATVRKGDKTIITRGVYTRQRFMKHKLKDLEGAYIKDGVFHFDASRSASDMLKDIQIYELYNSGCWKFTYNI
jgi:hypothetical protein